MGGCVNCEYYEMHCIEHIIVIVADWERASNDIWLNGPAWLLGQLLTCIAVLVSGQLERQRQ